MITKRLHDYFGFNRQQRNGLLVLCALSVLLLGIRLVYPLFLPDPVIQELSLPFQKMAGDSDYQNKSGPPAQVLATAFDPNTSAAEDWVARGLNQRSARALVRFREKGFVFRKAEDLQKIYGVSAEEYQRISPLMILPKSSPNQTGFTTGNKKKQVLKLEVNAADSAAWCALPGIGPAFARRILTYRNMLGGFARIEQLKEVYGLDEERYQKIAPYLLVNADSIRKIAVNTADFKTLARHPYIGYELTKLICNARRKTPFTAQSLCELPFPGDNCARVEAYLRFDP